MEPANNPKLASRIPSFFDPPFPPNLGSRFTFPQLRDFFKQLWDLKLHLININNINSCSMYTPPETRLSDRDKSIKLSSNCSYYDLLSQGSSGVPLGFCCLG